MTYDEVHKMMLLRPNSKTSDRKKVANNTYIEKAYFPVDQCHVRKGMLVFHGEHGGYEVQGYSLRLHKTIVLSWLPDGSIILNSGGWQTVTTKARINSFLPRGWTLYQERGVWMVEKWRNPPEPDDHLISDGLWLFEDGMILRPDSTVEGAELVDTENFRKIDKLRKSVLKYAKAFFAAIRDLKVGLPGNGDCMYCRMKAVTQPEVKPAVEMLPGLPGGENMQAVSVSAKPQDQGVPVGEVFRDKDHVLNHIKENYFVPSLVVRAMEVIPVSIMAHDYVMSRMMIVSKHEGVPEAWTDKEMAERIGGGIAERQVVSSLKRYCLRQLELPS